MANPTVKVKAPPAAWEQYLQTGGNPLCCRPDSWPSQQNDGSTEIGKDSNHSSVLKDVPGFLFDLPSEGCIIPFVMAGTTGTPLPKKLGIKGGHKVCLLNAPGHVERHLSMVMAANDVRITHDLRLPPVDVVVLFVDKLADLEKRVADIAARLHPAGGFWVAWRRPRSPARRSTDLTEDMVRRVALAAGMVDNKVCSIGDSWLGIRLVLRSEIRDAVAYRAAPPVPTLSRRTRRPTAPAKIVHRTSGAGSAMHRVRARSTK